jgi:hypothetical protein
MVLYAPVDSIRVDACARLIASFILISLVDG